jgi:hypothetical protein
MKLISIRASINKGLTERLGSVFTDIIPVTRPQVPKATLNSHSPGDKH